MRKYCVLTFILFLSFTVLAQGEFEEIMAGYKMEAERQTEGYIDKMVQNGILNKEDNARLIEFTSDTMKIEKTVFLFFEDENYSTLDMKVALSYQMDEYDKLLNKYYKLLINILSPEDKIKMRDAQRLWLKYRDSETDINYNIISPNKYMGGGTMWPVVAMERTLDLIKERVFSIFQFIDCIDIER